MSTFIIWLTEYTECQAFCPVGQISLGAPTPSPARKCGSPLGPKWGGHTRLRGRGWGPNSNEGTDTSVLYVYTVNYDKAAFHVASKPNMSGLFAGPTRQFLPLSFKTQPIESSPNAKLLFITNITLVKDHQFTQQKMLAETSETHGKYLVQHIEGKTAKLTLRSFLLVICFMCGYFAVSHASQLRVNASPTYAECHSAAS